MDNKMNDASDIDYSAILDREPVQCNAKTEVWSRVVGYYAGVHAMNRGKQAEFAQRKVYNLKGVSSGA